jgi:hypothetical protein
VAVADGGGIAWADMVQEVLEPLVHHEVPNVPTVENRRSFVINVAAGGKELGKDIVVGQVVVESELWGLLIDTGRHLDVGDFSTSDFYPDSRDEEPFMDLEAYLGW